MAFAAPRKPVAPPLAEGPVPFRPSLEASFRGHRQAVCCVAFLGGEHAVSMVPARGAGARDGAGEFPRPLSGGADGSLVLWGAQALRLSGHRGPVLGCAASPKSDYLLASCGHDGYARLWMPDLRRGASSSFSGRGTLPARSEGSRGEVAVWKAHASGAARALAFARDGSDHLYTAGDDRAVKCWDLGAGGASGGRFVGSFMAERGGGGGGAGGHLRGHNHTVRCVAAQSAQTSASFFHYIASGGDDGAALVWDTRSRQPAHAFLEAAGGVRGISFHPDGYGLATGDAAGNLFVYDLRQSSSLTGRRYGIIQHYPAAHGRGAVSAVAVAPQGGWLLSAGEDGAARLWDLKEGYLYCAVEGHAGPVRACAFSADGRHFATAGRDGVVMAWRSGLPPAAPAAVSAAVGRENVSTRSASAGKRPVSARAATPPPPAPSSRSASATAHGRPPLSPVLSRIAPDTETGDDYGVPPAAPPAAAAEADADGGGDDDDWGRERSFGRSEERYTPLDYPASAGAAGNHQSAVSSSSSCGGNRPPLAPVSGSSALEQSRRIENLEKAVASLASFVQEQREEQSSALEQSRQETLDMQDTQSNEIRELKAMVRQLLQQQEALLQQHQPLQYQPQDY